MADNSNNIDKLIREKLQGHKVAAPADGWLRLHEALHQPAPRRMLRITRAAAAAVLLMLAFGAGIFWSEYYHNNNLHTQTDPSAVIIDNNHDNSNIDNEIIDDPITSANSSENISSPRATYNSGTLHSDALRGDAENNFVNKSAERHSFTESSLYSLVPLKVELSGKKVIITPVSSALKQPALVPASAAEHYAFIFENNQLPADDPMMMDDEMLRRLLLGEDAYALQEPPAEKIAAPKGWSIGGQLSPVYSYRTLSGDVYITPDEKVDASYFDDMESGIVSVGGGISLDYQLGERFSIASGLYLSRIGQQNESVLAYNDPDGYGMYKLASSTGSVSVNPVQFTQVLAEQAASAKDIPGDYVASSTFVQNLDYLEVPLVLKYRLLDTRFGINLLGGISPGILVNNHSYFEFEGQKLQTGTTEDIQPMIYNSVLGIGMEYAISKKISVSLAPSFKYSLTPVNTSNNLGYHPYSLSWFTGVSYKLY
jgi:hypothetical protein